MRSSLGLSLLLTVAAACAQSVEGGGGEIDASIGGDLPDAPISIVPDARANQPDAFIRFDGKVAHDFNEPCGDRSECLTGICILGGGGGYCSKLCNAGGCPTGFGCFGVLGLIEPGQVSYVCVKDTNLLCTPCMSATECSSTSVDLCLPAMAGGSFCARDCTTVTCPDGYLCSTVNSDAGPPTKQCLPTSGACDCQAAQNGMQKECVLPTPAGDCKGTRTCLGAAGWGECVLPTVTDVPDGNFADENCDGIDGDVDDGLYVASVANGGEDNDTCGLTRLNPCGTISNGTRRAKLLAKKYVFVQAGTYNETVIMRDGVGVFGGYDTMWKRAPRSGVGHEVRIFGQLYAPDMQYVGILAHDLLAETTIADVNIVGATATGSSMGGGRSSYGVHAANAKLRVERVTINAGKGADGQPGGVGMGAPILFVEAGMNGTKGEDGEGGGSVCSTSTRSGGPAGTNDCMSYATGNPLPGKGGDGGPMDRTCPCAFSSCNAQPGKPGDDAATFLVDVYGFSGFGGSGGDDCGAAGLGGDGRIVNGDGGPGGKAGGRIMSRYWYAFPGDTGKLGQHGTGGGGGGGAGGCDIDLDSRGAGGGGGGAGGCAARGGGAFGEGGGGSFGILAVEASKLTIRNITIEQANAGKAGNGGTGGQGQSGGAGLDGGARGDSDSAPGGKGGNGAHGGHGGGGGGGAGGVSYGVFSQGSMIDLDTASVINDSGVKGGDPGTGGPSAPGAPLPERDGKPGGNGVAGTAGKTYTCINPNGC